MCGSVRRGCRIVVKRLDEARKSRYIDHRSDPKPRAADLKRHEHRQNEQRYLQQRAYDRISLVRERVLGGIGGAFADLFVDKHIRELYQHHRK